MSVILEQSQQLNQVIDKINQIFDEKILGNTEKQTLFLAYYNLDIEHIHSIYLLIQNNFNGSALALVRAFYETFYRALWMYAFATDEEVEKIRNDKFEFKNMGSKILELDDFYTGSELFKNMKKGTWNIMSDYAHSGTCQLSRRWTNGNLTPNYSDNEILEVLIETRSILILFAYFLADIHGFDDEEVLELLAKSEYIISKVGDLSDRKSRFI